MRVTIFGASGLLGKALIREWREDSVIGLSSSDADIRDEKRVDALIQEQRPNWIVLAAAYTDVDGCENDPELAARFLIFSMGKCHCFGFAFQAFTSIGISNSSFLVFDFTRIIRPILKNARFIPMP